MNDQPMKAGSASGPWSPNRVAPPPSRIAYEPVGYTALLKLHAVNTLLTVVTLTVWRFWAVTRVRRLLWAHIRFDDQPLEYTGTGLEIFIGFLKVVLLILLPIALIVTGLEVATLDAAPGVADTIGLIYVLGILWLITLGKYLSLRYRTSRTRWRGIRGRLAGTVGGYLWLTAWTYGAVVLTFGFFKPWMDARRIRYALDGARAGSLPAACRITGGDLFWSWLVAILLFWITLGLSYFWYRARLYRMVADRMIVGPLRFGFTASGWQHAWLWIGNMAMLFGPAVVTALAMLPVIFGGLATIAVEGGEVDPSAVYWSLFVDGIPVYVALAAGYLLLMPVVWERRIRFVRSHLVVLGTIDLAAIRQAANDGSTAGEGLAGDFDVF